MDEISNMGCWYTKDSLIEFIDTLELTTSNVHVELDGDDIAWLTQHGESEANIRQINHAIHCTLYKWVDNETGISKIVKPYIAAMLLGKENFLSGIERSTFHRTAVRECQRGLGKIFFELSD